MAVMENHPPVNLIRSIFLCNIFNFFLAAGKACLIPFLTLYFKKLGLTASQTGLIIGSKTFVGLVFAPLWSRCAVRCGKRRLVLMFSLLVMSCTYLTLTAVPSFNENAFQSRCEALPTFNESQWTSNITPFPQNHSNSAAKPNQNTSNTEYHDIPLTTVTHPKVTESPVKDIENPTPTTKAPTSSVQTTATSRPTQQSSEATIAPPVKYSVEFEDMLRQLLLNLGMQETAVNKLTVEDMSDMITELMNKKQGQILLEKAIGKLSPDQILLLSDLTSTRKRRSAPKQTEETDDNSSWGVFKKKLFTQMHDFRSHLIETEYHMFIVVMVILMVGESFCCPIEKLADDGWFEFLESIDDMEKYGMQRIWTTFAYILFPVIVTLSVDNTNCLFGQTTHPFMLHFYLFGAMIGVTFLLAIFFPMTTMEKYRYANKVGKGMRTVCCSARSLLMMLTLLIMGMVYAGHYNFLFWLLDDMGSQELTMGICLGLAALSEIPMLLFNEKLIQKIGNGGLVALSLLFASARCLYYSFLTTPWAVLPAELSHMFTHTALWWAVLSSPSFNTSPALTRSIRSILSSVYFGLGFGIGSVVSGFVYELYGAAILFQAGAVLAVGWFPVLGIGIRCCREPNKSQVKYTRLLTSDDASDTDSEDDWLEQALKDR